MLRYIFIISAVLSVMSSCGPYGTQFTYYTGLALAADRIRIEYINWVNDDEDDDEDSATVSGNLIGLDLVVAVEDNATAAWLDDFSDRLENMSEIVYSATRGQMYIDSAVLSDISSEGDVLVSPLTGEYADNNPNPGSGEVYVWTDLVSGDFGLAGEFPFQAFLQGLCYTRLGRGGAAEYDCTACALGHISPGSPVLEYCSDLNCTTGDPCWENYILKKYKDWTYPNTGYDPAVPDIEIIIENN